uniref:uncharacterized protein LOC122597176 n=1 Tax=Erigeron canadensis TaxID=72917 RepID=UPI001CB9AF37|nr:uncharacterized protein LOC122597176 [Erigeron canadensis]
MRSNFQSDDRMEDFPPLNPNSVAATVLPAAATVDWSSGLEDIPHGVTKVTVTYSSKKDLEGVEHSSAAVQPPPSTSRLAADHEQQQLGATKGTNPSTDLNEHCNEDRRAGNSRLDDKIIFAVMIWFHACSVNIISDSEIETSHLLHMSTQNVVRRYKFLTL